MINQAIPEAGEQYRDTLSLVDKKTGNRNWIYPKKPKGTLYTGRTWFSILLMILLFSGPFMRVNGHPLFLLNILERKFILFGIPFWPQDLPLFALVMITFVLFIIVFTVLFGRLWCGWACPQTVFMEMLFRKIEYVLEGDYKNQMKLNQSSWNINKIVRKSTKHLLFLILSFAIANTFLAYLISIDELTKLIVDGPLLHVGTFMALVIFTLVFYAVFSRMREIVCIVICPYGRLQGLMLDKNSIVVAYDFIRGEPRGIRKKNTTNQTGDCVDCHRCVQVCPTGIDIRNGTQLECINCTACIDECNDVMRKTHQPEGLIRYASMHEITNGIKKRITWRSGAYSLVLCILIAVVSYLLLTRSDIETTVLRTPGMTYQKQKNNSITNMYNFEVINKTFKEQHVKLVVSEPNGAVMRMVDGTDPSTLVLGEDGIVKGTFFIEMSDTALKQNNTHATLNVYSNGEWVECISTNFVGPVQFKN
jgi:cytochrome c oxidase accessory protein FixG